MSIKTISIVAAAAVTLAVPSLAAAPDWNEVARALGKAGAVQSGGVYRIGLPRTDLRVTLDGVTLKPGFALGSWLAFAPMGDQAMVMGDLVLTQDEVGPVMQKLEQEGIEITALHNHLLRAEPTTLYMHVIGHGDPVKLAAALHDGLGLSKTPLEGASGTSSQAAGSSIDFDTGAIDKIMGYKGKESGGIYQFGIPRAQPVKEHGMELPPTMGTATGINFQPAGGGKAAITGDFALIPQEVSPVMKALRENGIEVTALHSHMLDEEPRLIFMHFWANDDAQKLAKGLHAALAKIDVKRG